MATITTTASPRRGSASAIVAGLAVWTFRPRVVLAWTGRAVLALAAMAMMLGAGWGSPEALMASGAYGLGGLVMVVGSAVRL